MEKKYKQYRMLKIDELHKKLAEEASPAEGVRRKKYCFVLGAGASKSSGIKTGEELVRIWEEELSGANSEEHQNWKNALGITRENQSSFYSAYFSRRFQDPWDGHDYLEEEMRGKHPGAGYVMLADILCNTPHKLVITTNFDRMTEDAVARYQKQLPMVIGHEYLLPYYRPQIDSERVYILKIHRDLLLDPKNSEEETETLTGEWETCLDQVFQSYHPIFIGYAGNDKSLMEFLNRNAQNFRRGTWRCPYWTLYQKTALSPEAERFMNAAGGWVIQDCDFDRFLILLGDALQVPPWPTLEAQKAALEEDYRRIEEKMNATLPTKGQIAEVVRSGLNSAEPAAGKQSPKPEKPDEELIRQTEELSQAVERLTGDDDPNSRGARYRQAVLAINQANYAEAETLLRNLASEEPENAEYHYRLGKTLDRMARYEEAEAEKRRAVELDPKNAAFHNALAYTLYSMMRYKEAESAIMDALILEPESAEYHFGHGVIVDSMEKHEETETEFRRAIELEPENAGYHDSLGLLLLRKDQHEAAEAEVRRAVELEPENAEYHRSLGVTLHEMKRYKEAEAESRRALELEPENAEYHWSLGVTLHEMKRYEEAEAEKRRALELEPENAEYHCSRGVTLHEMKRYEEAEAETRRALELEPENAEYHNSLGVTLHAMKRCEEAEAEKRRAVELEPENAKYHRSLGVTLREMQRYDEALAEINKAIELDPEVPINYKSLSKLYKAMGKPEEAEQAEAKEKELEAKQSGG